ncbi:hypothetical protein HY483_02325 [Candidatus Woesearchaeota archaeon]|nr:hypothetical protein [Candidatus Woesearchaeota archaeon]
MKQKQRFACTAHRCGWKFNSYFKPELCPYCGTKGSVQLDTSRGAQDILEEIDQLEGEMEARRG